MKGEERALRSLRREYGSASYHRFFCGVKGVRVLDDVNKKRTWEHPRGLQPCPRHSLPMSLYIEGYKDTRKFFGFGKVIPL